MTTRILPILPDGLPVPTDDGAADHLRTGQFLVPDLTLTASTGEPVRLARLEGRTVVFVYPRMGRPDQAPLAGWDQIPGARGCTPQACAFRDLHADLRAASAAHVFGLSVQTTDWQSEAVARLHLPFPLLSDLPSAPSGDDGGHGSGSGDDSGHTTLGAAMRLPWFEVDGERLHRRLTLVLRDGRVEAVWYPVFPTDRNAGDVLAWLKANPL